MAPQVPSRRKTEAVQISNHIWVLGEGVVPYGQERTPKSGANAIETDPILQILLEVK